MSELELAEDLMDPRGRCSEGIGDMDQSLELLVRRGADPDSVISRRWDSPHFVVGRRTDCDLCLDDPTVSARHLYLQKLPGRVLVFDLGSRDFRQRTGVLGRPGFYLADWLPPGESVQIGDFQLSWTADAPASPSKRPDVDPVPRLEEPVAVWNVIQDSEGSPVETGRAVQHEVTLIGRGPLCRWKLTHESVSTTHASLVFAQGELTVVDLCSRYGVRVNGELVRSARLADGDQLSVGECHGVIRLQASRLVPQKVVAAGFSVPSAQAQQADDGPLMSSDGSDRDQDGPLAVEEPNAEDVLRESPASNLSGDLPDELQALISRCAEQQEQVRAHARQLMELVQGKLETSPACFAEPDLPEPAPVRADADSATVAEPTVAESNPELHLWLNHRLAGLNGDHPGRLSQFWKTLTGLF